MTEDELKGIEARHCTPSLGPNGYPSGYRSGANREDVFGLIAEVRRLQARLDLWHKATQLECSPTRYRSIQNRWFGMLHNES